MLPATRHKWTHPAPPAVQAGTQLTYPGGMEGWIDLVDLVSCTGIVRVEWMLVGTQETDERCEENITTAQRQTTGKHTAHRPGLLSLINPSEMLHIHYQIQICSDASEKSWLCGKFFISHTHEACDVSIPVANSKCPIIATEVLCDIMTDVIVCVSRW